MIFWPEIFLRRFDLEPNLLYMVLHGSMHPKNNFVRLDRGKIESSNFLNLVWFDYFYKYILQRLLIYNTCVYIYDVLFFIIILMFYSLFFFNKFLYYNFWCTIPTLRVDNRSPYDIILLKYWECKYKQLLNIFIQTFGSFK